MNDYPDKKIELKDIYELIDLYKYASIEGEKVELIVTPTKDNKRIITIGIQGGSIRDRDTFIFDDGELFDNSIYPKILSYYTHDDTLGNWDVIYPEYKEATIKGSNETKSGNLVYLDTYNKELFDNIDKNIEEVNEKVEYKPNILTNEDKVWDEILYYAANRRQLLDYYNGNNLDEEEKKNLIDFVVNVAENEKEISVGKTRKNKSKNEEIVSDLFNDKEKISKYGLKESLYNKLVNTTIVKKLAKLIGIEKRIRNRVDVNNKEIQEKIEFATKELEKVDYFDLKNINIKKYNDKEYVNNKSKAIDELSNIYNNESLYDENTRNNYKEYCNEINDYLDRKSNDNKKIVKEEELKYDVVFKEYDDSLIDAYDELFEAIDLVTNARINDEKYDIVVEKDPNNDNQMRVRVELLNGVTRSDVFNFIFTDRKKLEEKLSLTKDNNLVSNSNELKKNTEETDEFVKNFVEKSNNNDLIIKEAIDKLAFLKIPKDHEKYPLKKKLETNIINMLKNVSEQKEKQENKEQSLDEKLRRLENEINEIMFEQEENNIKNKEDKINEEFDVELYKELMEKTNSNSNLDKETSKQMVEILSKKMKLIDSYNSIIYKDELTKEDFAKLVQYETYLLKICEIDIKYQNNTEEVIEDLKNTKFMTPSQKTLLFFMENNEYSKKEYDFLFDVVKSEKEKEDSEEIVEIKDAYDEALSYSSIDSPASIKVEFEKNESDEADVIIYNKVGSKDIIVYQRTFEKEKLQNEIMPALIKAYTIDNEIEYNIKYDIASSPKACLLMSGRDHKTFKIVYGSQDFVMNNKKLLEEEFDKKNTNVIVK